MCLSYKNGEKIIKFNKNLSLGHKKKKPKVTKHPNATILLHKDRVVYCQSTLMLLNLFGHTPQDMMPLQYIYTLALENDLKSSTSAKQTAELIQQRCYQVHKHPS